HAHLFHQRFQRVVAHVRAADADGAAVHIPKSGDEVAKRRLAAAAGSDDGGGRLIRDGQGDVPQDGPAVVGEVHMVKGDIVAARTHVTALFIHFRQGVDLVGVVDGSAYQPQARHGA